MAKIDFEPDSAPLSGAITPTIDDISRLSEATDRVVWRSPTVSAPAGAQRKVLGLSLLSGIIIYVATTLLLPGVVKSRASAPVGVSSEPQLMSASTVYAVLKSPQPADYKKLNEAADNGVGVTLICPSAGANPNGAPAAKFQQFAADETLIVSEGFLLDGFRWFPLDKKRAASHLK